MQAPGMNLGRSQQLRGLAEVTREERDLAQVGTLCLWREVADLHILGHAAAKRGHQRLLCERKSATWRRRILSPTRCQGMGPNDGSRTGPGRSVTGRSLH